MPNRKVSVKAILQDCVQLKILGMNLTVESTLYIYICFFFSSWWFVNSVELVMFPWAVPERFCTSEWLLVYFCCCFLFSRESINFIGTIPCG